MGYQTIETMNPKELEFPPGKIKWLGAQEEISHSSDNTIWSLDDDDGWEQDFSVMYTSCSLFKPKLYVIAPEERLGKGGMGSFVPLPSAVTLNKSPFSAFCHYLYNGQVEERWSLILTTVVTIIQGPSTYAM